MPITKLQLTALFLVSLVFLAACNMQQLLWPVTAKVNAKSPNPHSACISCHSNENPETGSELFQPGIEISSLCLDCHLDYKENHHPTDFVPLNSSKVSLPLFGGKITCLTCHEIHGGANREGIPKLLRGGPYADRRMPCFKCHLSEDYASIDPHKMLDDNGNIMDSDGKPICLVCHSTQPDPEVDWTNTVRFRADVGFLCWRCHPPMSGGFFDKHFLVTPSAKTLATIQRTEERQLVILPLVPRNRITCSTCHNPHQKGVIQHEGAAKGADSKDRLRLPSICFGCHET